ncbi:MULTISPECIES: NAD(P)-binding domain-containing protein [unclassified Crossiella]|uniref:NAD(P)-dependent oxidoreductase n=1 Tax=unclassified Crossiella TaxID=2620835 RepID=UPI001FFEB6D5|nr:MULTISPECIES: NAD(P)-binding domain-containing protein [unclassified Crossiella]MCK2241915.1 NAD(P)-binding domain-containing protein [Crossiella sp. S99.2]MCK2255818.1 NAD(P)-binding domain-containing protein [Crossiella sp. S99.1]
MITVLGLGRMGAAIAGAFLNSGYATTVWNRSADKADPLLARGARKAADVAAAVADNDILLVCVLDYPALYEVLEPVRDNLSGKVLVNLTSGLPSEARAAADWARGLGLRYLDGTVLAVPPAVGQPQTQLFYAGDRQVYRECESVLGALGSPVYFGADPGSAAQYDLALLGILWATLTSALQGFALTGSGERLLPFVESWLTNVVLPSIRGAAKQVDSGDYGGAVSTVSLNAHGLAKIIQAGREQGIAPDLMAPIKEFLDRRLADGFGQDSLASIVEVIRNPDAPRPAGPVRRR